MEPRIKVFQIGLGPIGKAVTRFLLLRKTFEIVGALDLNPDIQGRDVGELAGVDPIGAAVSGQQSAMGESGAEVAVVTTTSSLEKAQDEILTAVEQGLHVVSTCEELSYPWFARPELARRIDEKARLRSVSVLGTGINPGFLMDFLPLALTGVCLDVKHITVERVQDASHRRESFRNKIGAGLDVGDFESRAEKGLLRHVGLSESMHLIAARLGWTLEKTDEVVEPVIAFRRVATGELTIESGKVIGVNQAGRGWRRGKEVITLIFRATVGEPQSYDRVKIEGVPDIDLRIPGGVNGDIGTAAVTVNAIPATIAAPPGLRTMGDIPPVSCFNASGDLLSHR